MLTMDKIAIRIEEFWIFIETVSRLCADHMRRSTLMESSILIKFKFLQNITTHSPQTCIVPVASIQAVPAWIFLSLPK